MVLNKFVQSQQAHDIPPVIKKLEKKSSLKDRVSQITHSFEIMQNKKIKSCCSYKKSQKISNKTTQMKIRKILTLKERCKLTNAEV